MFWCSRFHCDYLLNLGIINDSSSFELISSVSYCSFVLPTLTQPSWLPFPALAAIGTTHLQWASSTFHHLATHTPSSLSQMKFSPPSSCQQYGSVGAPSCKVLTTCRCIDISNTRIGFLFFSKISGFSELYFRRYAMPQWILAADVIRYSNSPFEWGYKHLMLIDVK